MDPDINFGKNQFSFSVNVDTHLRRDDQVRISCRRRRKIPAVNVVLCSRLRYYAFDHSSPTVDTDDRKFVRSDYNETSLCGCREFSSLAQDILSTSLSAAKPNISHGTEIHNEIVNDVVRKVKSYNDCLVIDMMESLTVKVFINEQVLDRCECLECNAIRESELMAERDAEKLLVPASESSMKKLLKRVRVVASDEGRQIKRRSAKAPSASDDCPICSDEFSAGKFAVQMPCSHSFHKPCIQKWLRRSHCCLICRYAMPVAADQQQQDRQT